MSTEQGSSNDQSPVFGTWTGWYALVLGVFAGLVGLFWWFSRSFR